MSVAQYYGILTKLWKELVLFCDADWSCPQTNVKAVKMIEKERVFEFLVGLDKELDEVRGKDSDKEILPSIREVFAEGRREQSRSEWFKHPSRIRILYPSV